MVDWDRVEELRSKGWGWDKIATDPKVGFRADASAGDPGRALRALYHRSRARERTGRSEKGKGGPEDKKGYEPKWNLLRVLYLVVPLLGIWFALAYFIPSPIGLVLPALPWLGLVLAAVALVLIWTLWRATAGPKWSTVYRNTVIGGVVLGLVVSGLIGLTGALAYGCPFLPPSSSLSGVSSSSWEKASTNAWQVDGAPVFFSFGATWCPYCSASSWAEWKALSFYGTVSGTSLDYSSASDSPSSIPEIVIANLALGPKGGNSPGVSVQILEDTSGARPNVPGATSCVQQAYLSSYSNGIPFVVLNGQFVHLGSLVNPICLQPWAAGANGGNGAVQTSVATEAPATQGGNPWSCVSPQAYWIAALLAFSTGQQITTLKNSYGWNATDTSAIQTDFNLIG